MRSQYIIILCMALWATRKVQGQTSCSTNTPTDLLGPFYLANSETTTNLAPDAELSDPQFRLDVSGIVYTSAADSCVGLADAVVEVWYAGEPNDNGYQDNEYRGQMRTDANGRYGFVQKFPSLYPSRPIIHDHIRISSNGQLLLVTQMYFYGNGEGHQLVGTSLYGRQTVDPLSFLAEIIKSFIYSKLFGL